MKWQALFPTKASFSECTWGYFSFEGLLVIYFLHLYERSIGVPLRKPFPLRTGEWHIRFIKWLGV